MLPSPKVGPLESVMRRVALAALLLLAVVLLVYVDRGGYNDTSDGSLDLLDCVYYATVTISTTGYGDITPVSDTARLVNIVVITPLRILFLIILVGTTLEVLAERTREDFRRNRWRHRVRDHYVVIGYGTKGRSAIASLRDSGVESERIVVVDSDRAAVAEAASDGLVAVIGDATRSWVLRQAAVHRAKVIVISAQRDDTAVLITLTARELNPSASIQASVREAENVPLLRQSGADHVVTSSEAAGRLLGVAAHQPNVSEVIEDLLIQGTNLDLEERDVRPHEIGRSIREADEPAVSLVRDGGLLPYDAAACAELRAGDRLIVVVSNNRRQGAKP
ncbi:potassium channel family protein [Actinocorallia longicatena]|uniref:Potassium channel family protein n=1 Tax=Actinocorallia longicatena TaxID=111803 RepID=A0ABP6QAD8_9ACTN